MRVSWPTTLPGRVGQLLFGLVVASSGIWLPIRANLGVASWEVLHIALAQRLGIGIGTASIAIGCLLVAVVAVLGLLPGIGTILNVLVVGACLNILLSTPLLTQLATGGVAEAGSARVRHRRLRDRVRCLRRGRSGFWTP